VPRWLPPLVTLAALTSTAVATPLRIEPVPGDTPRVRVELAGAGPLAVADLQLIDEDGRTAPAVLREAATSTAPVAVAVVFNGQEIWIGNEGLEPTDSPAAYPGAYDGMRAALTQLATSRLLPAGSEATLISYADASRTLIPWGPVAALAGPGFGDRRTHSRALGTALVAGVTLGLAALEVVPQQRRVLPGFGDGTDTSEDTAPGRLAQLAERAREHGIEVAAIVYKGALSAESTAIGALTARTHTVATQRSIPLELERVLPEVLEATSVVFDTRALVRDGRAHLLKVVVRGQVIGAGSVVLGAPPVAAASSTRWWVQLAAGLGLVGLGALLLWRRAGRAARPVG